MPRNKREIGSKKTYFHKITRSRNTTTQNPHKLNTQKETAMNRNYTESNKKKKRSKNKERFFTNTHPFQLNLSHPQPQTQETKNKNKGIPRSTETNMAIQRSGTQKVQIFSSEMLKRERERPFICLLSLEKNSLQKRLI